MVVKIGCKLPYGPTIEIGTPGEEGYKFFELNGWYSTKSKFGVTLIPAEVWEAWVKKNAKLRYVMDGSVYLIK